MFQRLTHPSLLLRLEGAVLGATSIFFFWRLGGNWWLFLLLILAPDLAMLGYLTGKGVGAAVYNVFHIELWPALLALAGLASGSTLLLTLGLIWLTHIGIDRLMGYGLKYPIDFKDTHLERV